MTFSIRSKLFSILLLATGSVVLCMYLVMSWSFDRGFLNYVHQQEQQKYQSLSLALAQHWQKSKGWQSLNSNRRQWDKLLSQHLSVPPPMPDVLSGPLTQRSPHLNNAFQREPPHGLPHESVKKPLLLDKDKTMLIGRALDLELLTLYSIQVNDQIVGYLGQLPQQTLSDELDVLFVQQQSQAFILVAVVMVIICMMAALPAAAHLVKPIRQLGLGTQRLISGHFDTLIAINRHDELGQLSKNFNTLANTLKQNEGARKQWIADISHELRTPLAILKAEIEAIQDGIRPWTTQALTSLHNEVEHLNRLINDLYELSMSDIGALNYQKEKIDVLAILQDCLGAFTSEFHGAGLSQCFDNTLNKTAFVLADSDRIKQLFNNLLKNTLRYTHAPGQLMVNATIVQGTLRIQFEDSLPGVSESERGHLFERLYRVEASRNRASGGAGLGLSICQNIVNAHSGSISAQASHYGGLGIVISLPLMHPKKGNTV